ncbi:MAG: hypothetical protein E7474_05030 [Ruminococcaceae bacterium]|nr:hypothetical protein [Oscillospiraceae bacterium]
MEQPIIAIAYLSATGRGVSPVEPFINENVDSITDAMEQKKAMEMQGLRGVMVFSYDAGNKPDYFTWGFVRDHMVRS